MGGLELVVILLAFMFCVSLPVGLAMLIVEVRALRRTLAENGVRPASPTKTLAELRPDKGRRTNVG